MMKYINFPRCEGLHSKQAHVDLPEGTYEREFGREGFFGPATHIYHKHPPTGWSKWEGNLRPLAFDSVKLTKNTDCPWNAEELMSSSYMRLAIWNTKGKMDHLVRNADGDQLLFIHAGRGDLFCDFGHLPFTEGDYIILPRSTMWRIECTEPAKILMIEATNDGYCLPDKGILGEHAIFDPAILVTPAINEQFKAQYGEKECHVLLKRNNEISTQIYPYNPLDAIGWKGNNLAVKLGWRDIRPVMSHRYHLAPSVHTTFLTPRFVVCTFVPRPFETDPGALKVPFYHSNNDFDEIIFYHMGEFFSRDNIHPGMLTLHPCGFPHGPHPKAFEASKNNTKKSTDEVAVMIDTRDSVEVSKAASKIEWKGYVDSWKDKK